MNWILIYFENYEHFTFYRRFRYNLIKMGFDFVAVTQKPSIYLYCKFLGLQCKLVTITKKFEDIKIQMFFKKLIGGLLSENEIKVYYYSVYYTFDKVVKLYNPKISFIFNGLSIPAYAQKEVSLKFSIKTVFFELANLPGKIFVAPDGVNANSIIYKNPDILEKYPSSKDEFEQWKDDFFNKKERFIQKTKKRTKIFRGLLFIADYFLLKIMKIPRNGEYKLVNKIREVYNSPQSVYEYDNIDLQKHNYIFFPLQVSNDTQIIINTDIDNIEAIKKISHLANQQNYDLVIKPHPKENNIEYIKKIISLKKKLNFYIINRPVVELIKNSAKVITINSSVGLIAMIIGKDIEFLGRTFYSKLEGSYIRNFILKFLINIEYKDTGIVSTEIIQEILERCDIETA